MTDLTGNLPASWKHANPGSDEADPLGCVRPRMDNAHGHGYLGGVKDAHGETVFVRRLDCPLHGEDATP